jgi:MFS family permease
VGSATVPRPEPPLSPSSAPGIATPDVAARRAVTAMFLANGTAVASFISRIPQVQADLGIGEATLGLVLVGVSIGVLTGLTTAGRLVPLTGSRRIGLAGAVIAVVALPLTGLAGSAPLLAATLLLLGVGASSMDVGMNAQGVGVERGYGRSIMIGFHAAWSAGTLLGALSGLVATVLAVSVAAHLTAVAVWIAALSVAAARWLRIVDRAAAGTRTRFALPRGPLLPFALIALASALGETTASNWSGIHLRDTVEVAASQVTWGYVAYTAAMVTVRTVGDRVVKRFGVQRVVRGGGLLAASGYLLLVVAPVLPAALLGFVLIGLGLGSTVPLAFARAGRVARTPGEGIAAVASVGYLAFLVGPPAIGWIAEVAHLSVAFALLAAILLVLMTRRLPDA